MITIRIPIATHEAAKKRAAELGCSLNAYIRGLLENDLGSGGEAATGLTVQIYAMRDKLGEYEHEIEQLKAQLPEFRTTEGIEQ